MTKRNIGIIGAGAIGSLFAYLLNEKNNVWLICKNNSIGEEINKKGITLIDQGKVLTRFVTATSDINEIPNYLDFIILAVKSFDTFEVLKKNPLIKYKTSAIVTIQNGIGNYEILANFFSKDKIILGVTYQGATLLEVGKINYGGKGKTVIGTLSYSNFITDISNVLNSSSIETYISEKIEYEIWLKLIVNAVINPLTAIFKVTNGKLLEMENLSEIMEKIIVEACNVTNAKGLLFNKEELILKVKEVCKATYSNISSMLQDITLGKKTEIEFINGAIVKEGKILGIETPVNNMLVNKILELTS